jgi:hypothetical protein
MTTKFGFSAAAKPLVHNTSSEAKQATARGISIRGAFIDASSISAK